MKVFILRTLLVAPFILINSLAYIVVFCGGVELIEDKMQALNDWIDETCEIR